MKSTFILLFLSLLLQPIFEITHASDQLKIGVRVAPPFVMEAEDGTLGG